MRILVSAYACEPGKGSEPGVGWNWVRQIARFNDVWVITRANNRQLIEAALLDGSIPPIHFIYFDLPAWARWWKKRGYGVQAYYCLWQVAVYFVGRRLHRQVRFDLVHHVTFVNYWLPSLLAVIPVPFMWGPVGGGDSVPRQFRRSFSLTGKVHEFLRDLSRGLAHLNPLVRLTAKRASHAFATTHETGKELRSLGCRRISLFSQTALPEEEIEALSSSPPHESNFFRLLSVGSLIDSKGFGLALNAFAHFHNQFPASDYWVIGDGPEQKRLVKLVHKLGVAGSVRFWGSMPRSLVLEKLLECDVLVHPSLRESGCCVCVEAMAAGRPVICLDLGGPGIQVTDETGIKVRPDSPQQVIHDLARAMSQLANDRVHRERLGKAARERVQQHLSWDRKGESMNRLYSSIVNGISLKTC